MHLKYVFLFFWLFISVKSLAQQSAITGHISNESNEPVEGATIVVSNLKDNTVIGYDITDQKGDFKVLFTSEGQKSILIKVSHINYSKSIDTINILKGTVIYDRKLSKSLHQLDEIIVKSQKIKDTMAIKTDSLNLSERSTLRDILNKTEGFVVSDDGGITFKGKKIDKILVNKKEVFINQNKIALDNLEYEIMEDLELINNYKDKFDMDFDNFTTSVININTKSKFKGILKAYGDIAFGYQDKYLIKLRSFFFSDAANMFMTSNTNNVGTKEFSFKDISEAFKSQSSDFFRSNTTDFFKEDDLLRGAFDSNTSLTVRKESTHSRLGIVMYYNQLNQDKNIFETTRSNIGELVKDENQSNGNKGNLFSSNVIYKNAISKGTVVSISTDIAYSNLKNSTDLWITNFLDVPNNIIENNWNKPQSLLSSSNASIKTKLEKNLLFYAGIKYDLEDSKNNFNSTYTFSEIQNILKQNFSLNNQFKRIEMAFDYRFNKFITSSLNVRSNYFDERFQWDNQEILRKGVFSNISLQLRGQTSQLEYHVKVSPQFYKFYNEDGNKELLAYSGSLSYKTNENNTIAIEFQSDNNLFDLNKGIDTLIVSYNRRYINTLPIENEITSNKMIHLNYNYSSVIKSQSFNTSVSFSEDKNYLESIFQDESNNIYYYSNRLIDKMKTMTYSVSAGKGFYISKQYHLIRIKGGAQLSKSKFPTFTPEKVDYEVNNYLYKASIGIEPKLFFIEEASIQTQYSQQIFLLEDNQINKSSNLYIAGLLKKETEHLGFKLIIGQSIQKNQNFKFKTPILNFEGNLKISDKVNLFLKSKYLFHLFNFPNTHFTNLNNISDGNLIYSNYNTNNLNYLMIGTSYKF